MVFNATFNNIAVISWQSILMVEETSVPGENHRPVASHWQTLSYNVVSSTSCDYDSPCNKLDVVWILCNPTPEFSVKDLWFQSISVN